MKLKKRKDADGDYCFYDHNNQPHSNALSKKYEDEGVSLYNFRHGSLQGLQIISFKKMGFKLYVSGIVICLIRHCFRLVNYLFHKTKYYKGAKYDAHNIAVSLSGKVNMPYEDEIDQSTLSHRIYSYILRFIGE